MKTNTFKKYYILSLTKKMNVQFKKLEIERRENKLSVEGLYIIDDNRYIYHVLNKMKEEFYIINKNDCIKMKIESKLNNVYSEDAFDYICDIGNNNFIDFTLHINEDEIFKYFSYIDINDEFIPSKLDGYLYNMFYDIYKMKYSE